MIEDLLAEQGITPDVDDDQLGAAYEACPAVEKSIIKNAVSFAYALAQDGAEPLAEGRRFGHVERRVEYSRLDWAFFAVDQRRFPLTAVFSALALAVVAKVETLIVHVSGPLTDHMLFGCDFLSVTQIHTSPPAPILDVLSGAGRGVVVDLAGLELNWPRVLRPEPADYGISLDVEDSEYAAAYRAVTAHVRPQPHPYLCYGGMPGTAPVVLEQRLLGCFIWDVITVHTFRQATSFYA